MKWARSVEECKLEGRYEDFPVGAPNFYIPLYSENGSLHMDSRYFHARDVT
jgi:hypothetical protein